MVINGNQTALGEDARVERLKAHERVHVGHEQEVDAALVGLGLCPPPLPCAARAARPRTADSIRASIAEPLQCGEAALAQLGEVHVRCGKPSIAGRRVVSWMTTESIRPKPVRCSGSSSWRSNPAAV